MNRLETALKNLPQQFKGITFEKELKEIEKDYVHVLHLKQIHLPAEKRYIVDSKIGKYSVSAWNQMKVNLSLLGYEHNYIIHHPEETQAIAAKKAKEEAEEKVVQAAKESKGSDLKDAQASLKTAVAELKIAKEGKDKSEIEAAQAKAKAAENALTELNK